MKVNISIIPEDNIMVVDGVSYEVEIQFDNNIRAIQWHNGAGHIEYKDGSFNKSLNNNDYELLKPYLDAWEKSLIVETPEPIVLTEEQIKENTRNEILNELADLDSKVQRAVEDLYVASNITPHTSIQAVIDRKVELRKALASL